MTKRIDDNARGERSAMIQCPGCHTHVKSDDTEICPFCETSLSLTPRSGHVMTGARRSLSRRSSLLMASLFGMSTLAGVAIQACDNKAPTEKSATEKPGGDAGTNKDGGSTPDQGTKPDTTGGKDEGTVKDTPVLPPYGIPPDRG